MPKSKSKTPDFDERLVVTVKGLIDFAREIPTYRVRKDGDFERINELKLFKLTEVIDEAILIDTLMTKKGFSKLVEVIHEHADSYADFESLVRRAGEDIKNGADEIELKLNEALTDFCNHYPGLFEIMHAGRLQISVLIDSSGGEVALAKMIENLVKVNRSYSGSTYVFGGNQIGSAAAEIFMGADKKNRYFCPSSELLFHLSSRHDSSLLFPYDAEEPDKIVLADEHEDMRKIKSMLMTNVTKKHRDEMEARINRVFSGQSLPPSDRPILFGSDEMKKYELGVMVQDLRRQFSRITRTRSKFYRDTEIDDFFLDVGY